MGLFTRQHNQAGLVATKRPVHGRALQDQGKSATLKLRVLPEFKQRLEQHAKARGLEFSAWARQALRLQADREATYLPPPPLAIDARDQEIMNMNRKVGENGKEIA